MGKLKKEYLMSQMKGAVRCKALTMEQLAAQEKHGKREDRLSQLRVVRDSDPLVFGSLDLRDAYDAHMEGVKQNSAAKRPVLHFIVRFPPELLSGPVAGRFKGSQKERQEMMLAQAIRFIQDTHGGSAVFAGRLDTDETGETIADVFAVPRYEKRTKRTGPDQKGAIWASATKFGKELAEKHQAECRRRHPDAKPGLLTAPRMVGIALQSEFADWFEMTNGFRLAPKAEKETRAPDRLEKEAHDRLAEREATLDAQAVALRAEKSRISTLAAELTEARRQASGLLSELWKRVDLTWDIKRDLRTGLRELVAALQPKKKLSPHEQIVADIEARIGSAPDKPGQPFEQTGPGF
jgi:hypothetical protein